MITMIILLVLLAIAGGLAAVVSAILGFPCGWLIFVLVDLLVIGGYLKLKS